MEKVEDFTWKPGMTVEELADDLGNVGFQSVEIRKAVDTVLKMKRSGSKIFLTFTSNMVTSGLRGFFAQLIKLGIPDVIVTTVGGLEEDIMKSHGEEFILGDFSPDDVELYEKGTNRVGNIFINNESYERFEDIINPMIESLYEEKNRWPVSEMLEKFGDMLDDESSILYQASEHGVPIFCPGITDGAFGFHLYMFQEKHDDFVVDVVKDFKNVLFSVSHDDRKGLIALGGGISKHHAILAGLLSGGLDYAVYMTTSRHTSGSMSGATTDEAKSWGKVKDSTDVVTVIGDVTFTFTLMMSSVLEKLRDEGVLNGEV